MVELRHASHCVYKIRYHIVLSVKYRKKLLLDEDRISVFKNLCSEISKRYWFEFDTLGCDGDHVHLFVGASPKYAPSRLIQIIKSITAREFWSDGGYVGTVGEGVGEGVTADIIRNYIESQGTPEEKEKHSQMRLLDF